MAPNGETDRHRLTQTATDDESTFVADDRLHLYINERWYDLTRWQNVHPGGREILQHLNGKDATDAFYSLHSEEAIQRLARLKSSTSYPMSHGHLPMETTELTRSFRMFRKHLISEGFFQRSIAWEFFYQALPYFLCLLGTYAHFAWNSTFVAILAIGLGMQQAGWIGHDYAHGRGPWMRVMCQTLSGFINAFSPTWWSQKHNTHHVYTNHLGIDTDVANDPIFHLFTPSKDKDVWFRSYQHFYYLPVYSLLYLSWRWQSIQYAFRMSNYQELTLMLPSYLWLYSLGWQVALGSVLLGGFLVAAIVTATHQSEEMLEHNNYSFVETQFLTTCDANCENFFMEWLWGGMQYQLEHHLFPTMPKYRYAQVRPLLEQWAKNNGLKYKSESVWSIWYRNYQTLKHFAH